MRSLLRAKGFTWIPPVEHILVLVLRFDREVCHDISGKNGKNGARFEFNFFSTKARVSINGLLRR